MTTTSSACGWLPIIYHAIDRGPYRQLRIPVPIADLASLCSSDRAKLAIQHFANDHAVALNKQTTGTPERDSGAPRRRSITRATLLSMSGGVADHAVDVPIAIIVMLREVLRVEDDAELTEHLTPVLMAAAKMTVPECVAV